MEKQRREDWKSTGCEKLLNIGPFRPLRAFAPSLFLFLSALASHAAPPTLETLFPCGGKAGGTSTVTATGSNLDKGHPEVWTDHPGIVFKPGEKPKTFAVTIAPEVPPGPHLVRFFNKEGASAPRVFVIGAHDEFTDTEPNDDHLSPQRVPKLPATVHGKLEKSRDVDTFAVELKAGATFVAQLQGYALGSQMDPAMKLLDARGVEVALGHDSHNLDPFLRYDVKDAGIYHVQLMGFAHPPAADVALKGSSGHIYRLTLSDAPHARAASPCAVQRGQTAKVNTARGESVVDATQCLASEGRFPIPTPDGEPTYAALVTPAVSMEEEEAGSKTGQRLTPPFAVTGVIARGDEQDRYVFLAKKGDTLLVRVHAASIHSPLDATLRINDATGKALQQADDAGDSDRDPSLIWKAPADGDFTIIVKDLFQRGGPEFCYALEVTPPVPQVAATLAANSVKIDAGKTAELKTTVKVSGTLKGKLTARVTGLPTGVTAKEVEVPAKGGDVKVTLSAAPDAAAAALPVELRLSTSEPDEPLTFAATYDLRGTEPRGDRLINEDSRVWLTVTPSAKPAPPAAASTPSGSAAPPTAAPAAKP